MKKVVLGLGMLFSGVVGIIGIMITSILYGTGLNIEKAGISFYFYIFFILIIAGLIIAIKAAYNNKQNP